MAKKKHKKKSSQSLLDKVVAYEYKHTTSALLLIIAFVLLLDTAIVQTLLDNILALGYLGMILSGILFVSFFTAAPAVVLLVEFGSQYNPVVVAIVAGFGAMLGDWLILRTVEDKIGKELLPLAKKLKLMQFINLLHKKSFAGITQTIGALIIASPLPDEAGLALLGLSHISTKKLLFVTYVLNTVGILIIVGIFSV
jgi:hypothetical protein